MIVSIEFFSLEFDISDFLDELSFNFTVLLRRFKGSSVCLYDDLSDFMPELTNVLSTKLLRSRSKYLIFL